MSASSLSAMTRARRMDRGAKAYLRVLINDPCAYCGAIDNGHLDHIEPHGRGGSDAWDNLTSACRSCNSSKSNLSLLGYLGRRIHDVTARLRALEAESAAWKQLGAIR